MEATQDLYNDLKADPAVMNLAKINEAKELLSKSSVQFTEKENGTHLVVAGPESLIDFYPATGEWLERSGKERISSGIARLLHYIDQQNRVKQRVRVH